MVKHLKIPGKSDVDKNLSSAYKIAQPYPYIVLDNFLPEELAQTLHDQFLSPESSLWHKFHNSKEIKYACDGVEELQNESQDIINELLDEPFLEYLSALTGQDKLSADPYFMGGGLHYIPQGGKLGIHTDFNFHPHLKKTRKLNFLLYLNKEWKDEYGGHLEIWDRDMKTCAARVRPVFNRAVIFTIDDTSWHGHPHPLTCPEGEGRKSLAMYYYTEGMPEHCHSTIFQELPDNYNYSLTPIL